MKIGFFDSYSHLIPAADQNCVSKKKKNKSDEDKNKENPFWNTSLDNQNTIYAWTMSAKF